MSPTTDRPTDDTLSDGRRAALRAALEHAAHMLPAQPPIHVFVHHNTLHAFQHLPFDEAVIAAAARFGTEPYEPEEAFATHLEAGRITRADIEAVLADEHLPDTPLFEGGPSLCELWRLRLLHPLERVEDEALTWLLHEGPALERFHPGVDDKARARVCASARRLRGRPQSEEAALRALYGCLGTHAPLRGEPRSPRSARSESIAQLCHPLLIRVCGAFIDQGVAYWPMPGREAGLLEAFARVYGDRHWPPPDPWQRKLAQRLSAELARGLDAERIASDALAALAVPETDWPMAVEARLRALPGWAGMIAQLQARPDRAPITTPKARLMDYLAVYLLLETEAVAHLDAEASNGPEADNEVARATPPLALGRRDDALVYEAFIVAQLAGLGPAELSAGDSAKAFLDALRELPSAKRRRLWHLAYERNHRQRVLDAMLAHARAGIPPRPAPAAQALFCIDEREGSLRRHIEELDAGIETLGYAGFYGVPMAYQGLEDVRPAPLCPVVMRPRHLVRELAVSGADTDGRRRVVGGLRHAARVGSQTAVRGGALTATLGLLAVVPLIGRVLFPRLAERMGRSAHHALFEPPTTRLQIERLADDQAPGPDGLFVGFLPEEMADIVASVLCTTGLMGRLAPLVAVVGHGSSSLNNPHESAHDCGATGGGRGGPNARAFAAMANHPRVRRLLAERGLPLGDSHFVGGYHNTCDDSVDWYDTDLLPESHRPLLSRLHDTAERARRLDAHERCRRFESARLSLSPERALSHVEGRAVDLGEPRPEYGHATNAICIVGRRERTRGLFLDRRAFLVSYDPTHDPDGEVLGPLLASVGPVSAGINLEYYFSFVDPTGYGCGTKLPHNINGLLGVMDGHASDLRTGLPWQMVEIHEPVRLLMIVEAEPERLEQLLDQDEGVRELVVNRWIQVVAWSPSTDRMFFFSPEGFVAHEPESAALPVARTSSDHYGGKRGHLAYARIEAALHTEPS